VVVPADAWRASRAPVRDFKSFLGSAADFDAVDLERVRRLPRVIEL